MPRPGFDNVVLVTGFPSFLAKKLVLHLVASEPRTSVITLVRSSDMVEARHMIDALDPHDRERISLLEGDPAGIDLGLSGVELRQLAGDVDRIHHATHVSYLGTDKKTAEQMNVLSAGEIVEVAKQMTNLRCLVLHSTAFVSGDRRGTVYEEDTSEGVRYRNIVEDTRARAERIVRRASKSIPVAIVRPSLVVGDSGTGEIGRINLPYLFTLLLLAAPADLALPLPARGDVPLHFVPIDFVVRAACAIGNDARAPGRTFHLVDPTPLPVKRYIELIHQIRARRASWANLGTLARSVLRTPGIEGYLRNPKALVDQLLTSVHYDTRNADLLLSPLGIACPPITSYAEKIVAAVEERLMGRAGHAEPRTSIPPPAHQPTTSTEVGSSGPPGGPEESPNDEPSHETDAMD